MLIDFQNSFVLRLSSKCVTMALLKVFLPQVKYVAALPCETRGTPVGLTVANAPFLRHCVQFIVSEEKAHSFIFKNNLLYLPLTQKSV